MLPPCGGRKVEDSKVTRSMVWYSWLTSSSRFELSPDEEPLEEPPSSEVEVVMGEAFCSFLRPRFNSNIESAGVVVLVPGYPGGP